LWMIESNRPLCPHGQCATLAANHGTVVWYAFRLLLLISSGHRWRYEFEPLSRYCESIAQVLRHLSGELFGKAIEDVPLPHAVEPGQCVDIVFADQWHPSHMPLKAKPKSLLVVCAQ
jgi:hypothetical protein